MVCLANEVLVKATIRDTIGLGQKRQSTIVLSSSKQVNSIFDEVASDFHYEVDAIQLTVQTREYTVCFFPCFFFSKTTNDFLFVFRSI